MEARSRVIKMLGKVHRESESSTTEKDDPISRLNRSSYVNRALNIARLTLLWKEHFHNHPSHKGVATLLLETGNQQQCFISTDKSTSSKLTLTSSPVGVLLALPTTGMTVWLIRKLAAVLPSKKS